MTELTLAIIAAVAAISLIGEIARIRSRQLDAQAMCREEFFRTAERLISDPETPEKAIDEIDALAHRLTSRAVMWGFVWSVLMGHVPGADDIQAEYQSMPPHLRKDLVMVWVSAIFALTFNNFILGAFIRRFMLYSVPRSTDGDFAFATPVAPMVDEFTRHRARSVA